MEYAPLEGTAAHPVGRQGFVSHTTFHALIVATARNSLITVAAQPVFAVLQRALKESNPGKQFDREVDAQHSDIVRAIDDGNANSAAALMKEHLDYLRPYHERAWSETH